MLRKTLLLIAALVVAFLAFVEVAAAAPTYRIERTLLPEADSTYELGTSTRAWLRGTFDELCLTADSCQTSFPDTTPGGSDTQVQFNDNGSFGGDSAFTWDKVLDKLTATNAQFTTATTTNFHVTGSGTSTFAGNIDIAGNLEVSGHLYAPVQFTTSGDTTIGGDLDVTGALTLGTALVIAEGGTGATTFTNNRLLTGNGTSALVDESGLTFDGSLLDITGNLGVSGDATTTGTHNIGTLTLDNALAVAHGGTGTSTTPSSGQLLLGNSLGGYDLVATSTLGISGGLWTESGSDIYYNGGNVGIGTTGPLAKLDVYTEETLSGDSDYNAIFQNVDDTGMSIALGAKKPGSSGMRLAGFITALFDGSGNDDGKIIFKSSTDGAIDLLTLDSDNSGQIGIGGVVNPATDLQIHQSSGSTNNPNWLFDYSDTFPALVHRSGTTNQFSLIGNGASATVAGELNIAQANANFLFRDNANTEHFRLTNGTGMIGNQGQQTNHDFIWRGDTVSNLIFADVSADRVGIGAAPSSRLHVSTASDTTSNVNGLILEQASVTSSERPMAVLPFFASLSTGNTTFNSGRIASGFVSDGSGYIRAGLNLQMPTGADTFKDVLTITNATDSSEVRVKASTATARVGGVLNTNVTTNTLAVTGAETNLMTYTIATSTLSVDGDYIDFEMTGTASSDNPADSAVDVYYGATLLKSYDWSDGEGGNWMIRGRIYRTGATSQLITYVSNGGGLITLPSYVQTTASETLSGAVILKATGSRTDSGDTVNQKLLTASWWPAN